jgi:hypothetical protein
MDESGVLLPVSSRTQIVPRGQPIPYCSNPAESTWLDHAIFPATVHSFGEFKTGQGIVKSVPFFLPSLDTLAKRKPLVYFKFCCLYSMFDLRPITFQKCCVCKNRAS